LLEVSSTLDALESFKRAAHSTSSFVAFGNEIQALALAAKNSSAVSIRKEKKDGKKRTRVA